MKITQLYDALLLDLDGTVWTGDTAIPNAVRAVTQAKKAGVAAAYITNNASRPPAKVAAKLTGMGLASEPADVLTSAQAAVQLATKHASEGDPILVVGAPSFADLVREAGFVPVTSADEHPAVVLHGHSPDNGWRQLSEAALAIAQGATYIASNLDTTLPMDRGLMVGNGSMVAAVTSATGVVPQAAGKPEPAMFDLAKENLGSARPLAVGDRLDTDIAGGVAAQMDALHVLTGVSGPLALIAAPSTQRPTLIAEDLSVLIDDVDVDDLRPAPQGGFTARRDGDEIVLDGGDTGATPLQALRTALFVAWADEKDNASVVVTPASDAARAATQAWW
ncbi:HAD-IIA family hydrolase [Corynebacterium appendicis]|uniref:HAD-IIA family hydrolase n=1 Tax=Corynebacterium appendicis TaxID=163202 RepID=UPI0023549D25|nr:HAD-IIA family hydrolase [Corynebacterium appendicis]